MSSHKPCFARIQVELNLKAVETDSDDDVFIELEKKYENTVHTIRNDLISNDIPKQEIVSVQRNYCSAILNHTNKGGMYIYFIIHV